MMVTDANCVILQINQAFTESTGYSAEEAVGQTPRLLKSGHHDEAFYREMWQTINRTGGWRGEIWDRRKNGESYPKWLVISAVRGDDGAVTHYVGTHFDITERKKAEGRIQELAYFDQLTGLPNRTLLLDRLNQAMTASGRSGCHCALLFIDLDDFKTLNDTLGHYMGDLLLKEVAKRLKKCVREGDTVARLGGDEFVVVLSNLDATELNAAADTEAVALKILSALSQSYGIGNVTYRSTASIGATLFIGSLVSIEDLMKETDLCMYKAKAAGRNTFRFFDPAMEVAVKTRAALEEDLELTESLLVHDVDEIAEKMFVLKANGVRFSIDDFGTGYSSLSYLKRLPVDQLKIDRSFVRDILDDPNDAAIARTVVTLAGSLGMSVIAEGVETAEQRDFLAGCGCPAYQGYFFSPPLPIDAFEEFARSFFGQRRSPCKAVRVFRARPLSRSLSGLSVRYELTRKALVSS
ncbi:MAG: diguanylate cyclase [Holophagaceae bacterium]|nr:diguanylate cyclase [Holophagaceae bacterium]